MVPVPPILARDSRMMLSDLTFRKLSLIVLAGLVVVPAAKAIAGQWNSDFSRPVLARRPGVELFEGQRVVQKVPPGMLLDVIKANGAWLWTGRGWVRESDVVSVEQAVAFFDSVFRDSPSAFVLVNRARAKFELRQYDSAIADCTMALELEPRHVSALCTRGRAHTQKNAHDRALADLSQAIELDPNLAAAYVCRAQVWLNLQELDKALDDASRGVQLDSKSASALAVRGKILSKRGEYDRAIADFDAALRINPDFHPVWNNRGNVWFKKGEFSKAIDDYTAALQFGPSAQIYLNRAIAWNRLGATDKANEDYARMAQLDPSLAPAASSARAN
jgi:tetratricopeptide (TPR) repeat protein